jgi:hypothetical protein
MKRRIFTVSLVPGLCVVTVSPQQRNVSTLSANTAINLDLLGRNNSDPDFTTQLAPLELLSARQPQQSPIEQLLAEEAWPPPA